MSGLVASNTRLAWNLLKLIHDDGLTTDGAIFSPVSITIALGLLAGGAAGSHRDALCGKLGVDDEKQLSSIFSEVPKILGIGQEASPVEVANAVFTDTSVDLLPDYLGFLKSFNADTKQFPSLSGAYKEINTWISDHTKEMIQDMLTEDSLTGSHIALVNALAFKGVWKQKFDGTRTKKNYEFYIGSGQTRYVDMMFLNEAKLAATTTEDYTAVKLPYTSGTSLIAYLPQGESTIGDLIGKIADESGPVYFDDVKYSTFGFPKFEMESSLTPAEHLTKIGYPIDGNYPKIAEGINEFHKVLHKAKIKLDEEGTVAAAATVMMMRRAMVQPIEELIFNRPFVFTIVSDESEMVLFTGVFTRK